MPRQTVPALWVLVWLCLGPVLSAERPRHWWLGSPTIRRDMQDYRHLCTPAGLRQRDDISELARGCPIAHGVLEALAGLYHNAADARSPAAVLVLRVPQFTVGLGNVAPHLMAYFMMGAAAGRAVYVDVSDARVADPSLYFAGHPNFTWHWPQVREEFVARMRAQQVSERVLTFARWNKLTDPPVSTEHEAAEAIERAVRDTSRSPWLTLAWEQSEWFEGFGKVFSPITTLHARAVDIAAARAARLVTGSPDWLAIGDCAERMHHCLMHGVFRPREALASALLPALRSFDAAEAGRAVISVHLRTGYSDLAPRYKNTRFLSAPTLPKSELLELMNTCGGGLTASATTTTGSSSASSPSTQLERCWLNHFVCWDAWPPSLVAAPSREQSGSCWEALTRPQPRCTEKQLMRDFDVDLASASAHTLADPAAARSAARHARAEAESLRPRHRSPVVSRVAKTCLEDEWTGGYNHSCLQIRRYAGMDSLASALACAATMAQRLRVGGGAPAPGKINANTSDRDASPWSLFVASDAPGMKELAELLPFTRGRTFSIATPCDNGECHMAEHGRGQQTYESTRAATMAEWLLLGLARFQVGIFFSTFSCVGASRSVWLHRERYYEMPGAHPVLIFSDRLMKALETTLCEHTNHSARARQPRSVCRCDGNAAAMHACLEAEFMIVLRGSRRETGRTKRRRPA